MQRGTPRTWNFRKAIYVSGSCGFTLIRTRVESGPNCSPNSQEKKRQGRGYSGSPTEPDSSHTPKAHSL